MIKCYVLYGFSILFFLSCEKNPKKDEPNDLNTDKEYLKENIKLIELIKNQDYSDGKYKGSYRAFDLQPYYQISAKLSMCFDNFSKGIDSINYPDTLKLNAFHSSYVKTLTGIIDSLNSAPLKPFYQKTKEPLRYINNLVYKRNNSINFEHLKLKLKYDFEVQALNTLIHVYPKYWCPDCYRHTLVDLLTIQTNNIDTKTFYITLKINGMYGPIPDDWNIEFNKLEKIVKDTLIRVDSNTKFTICKKIFKSTEIVYERGSYLLTINLYHKLPDGSIKVNESSFEFDLK